MNDDRMTPEALAEIANRAEMVTRNHADWSVSAAVLLAGRDVPALLAEVERLRTAEESLAVENDRLRDALKLAQTRREDVEKENERLDVLVGELRHTLLGNHLTVYELNAELRNENARLRAEVAAAKRDLKMVCDKFNYCRTCAFDKGNGQSDCGKCPSKDVSDYVWRGVCPANTPAQGETDEKRGGGEQ